MPVNLNETRTLIAALEQSYPPSTLLRDTFFPTPITFPTKSVDMDYKKGGRKLAPFVAAGSSGVNVARTGFETKSYTPPIMMPKRPVSIQDIEQRGFGEPLYSPKTPQQ